MARRWQDFRFDNPNQAWQRNFNALNAQNPYAAWSWITGAGLTPGSYGHATTRRALDNYLGQGLSGAVWNLMSGEGEQDSPMWNAVFGNDEKVMGGWNPRDAGTYNRQNNTYSWQGNTYQLEDDPLQRSWIDAFDPRYNDANAMSPSQLAYFYSQRNDPVWGESYRKILDTYKGDVPLDQMEAWVASGNKPGTTNNYNYLPWGDRQRFMEVINDPTRRAQWSTDVFQNPEIVEAVKNSLGVDPFTGERIPGWTPGWEGNTIETGPDFAPWIPGTPTTNSNGVQNTNITNTNTTNTNTTNTGSNPFQDFVDWLKSFGNKGTGTNNTVTTPSGPAQRSLGGYIPYNAGTTEQNNPGGPTFLPTANNPYFYTPNGSNRQSDNTGNVIATDATFNINDNPLSENQNPVGPNNSVI